MESISVLNPLAVAVDETVEEQQLDNEWDFEAEADELQQASAGDDTLGGLRPLRKLSKQELRQLTDRFQSCFDAMDTNEDGVIPNDRDNPELRAALQLQGLQPSDAQLESWRKQYGLEFTREQFVDAMLKTIGRQPGKFSATEWSHANSACARIDCLPIGKDKLSITPDTITITRTKCRLCFCGCKSLGDTVATNIETFRSRWVHIHVPLIKLEWVSAYWIEGMLVYTGVAFLAVVLAPEFSAKSEEIKDMPWSVEKVVGMRELWFGANLVAGFVACLLWWSFRLAWQSSTRHGHAYFFAVGTALLPGDEVESGHGRCAVSWDECDPVVDEFLSHKGCHMKIKEVEQMRNVAEKKTTLLKVLSGNERQAAFKRAGFLVQGLKQLQGTAMDNGRLGVITDADMTVALLTEPDQQVETIVNILLEPQLREMKESGLEVLRKTRQSYEDLEMGKLLSRLSKRLAARIEPSALDRSGEDETDEDYKKRIVDLAMESAEVKFGFRLNPSADHQKRDKETEAEYLQRLDQLPPIEGSQYDEDAKGLKSRLLARTGATRSEHLLGKIRLDEHVRAAHLDPVYSEGQWMAKPGGRWYVWNRWWLGEETSIYIGEHTFKASSVMRCGTFCRRREHLASHTMDLVWVHAAKRGRSLRRFCSWAWSLTKVLALFSLAVAVMWSISFPNCDQNAGCEHLELAERIDYSNCELECEASSCNNLACARSSVCDDIVIANASIAQEVNGACSAGADVLDQLQSLSNISAAVEAQVSEIASCDAVTERAERARAVLLNMPATCEAVIDADARAKAYKLYLDVSYLAQDGAWLGPVARLGGESCALAAAVDKCSGCHGRQRCSRNSIGDNYQAHTQRGEAISTRHFPFEREGFYPSDFELCSAISEAQELSKSQFCPNATFTPEWKMIRKACICRAWWEKFVPDKEAFFVAFFVSFTIGIFVVLYIWLRWVPETVDFGLSGMQYSASTAGFTVPPGESIMATIDLLETKLGREVSLVRTHEPWVYKPSFRYLNLAINGFEESLTVYEDFVHLATHSGVPICCSKRLCSCCCCDPHGVWADQDNYFLLLENVTFIEVGSDFFWLFDILSKLFIRLAAFFLLVEYVFMEPLQMFQDVVQQVSVDIRALDDSWIMKIWLKRYAISAGFFLLWLLFKVLAGNVWKRGYVSLHCLPGGTERGRASKYVGRSPFFVRIAHPDPDQFREDIATIRAAVRKSRVEVKARYKEQLMQIWVELLHQKNRSPVAIRFKNKLKAAIRSDIDDEAVQTTHGRIDFLATTVSKQVGCRQVELSVRDSRYLEYFETEREGVVDDTTAQEAPSDQGAGTASTAPERSRNEAEDMRSLEAVVRDVKRSKAHSGQIDLTSVIAVRVEPLAQTEANQAFLGMDRANTLNVMQTDGTWKFSFEDADEQNKWQVIIEEAARVAQALYSGPVGGHASMFTRYLVRRDEEKIISDFSASETADPELAKLREQVARIFCAIDKNHDRTISYQELSTWLITGTKGQDHKQPAEVIKSVQQKFQKANAREHRIRITLDEFWTLMHNQEIIEELKQARLWTHLALKHIFDEKALGQMFGIAVSQTGNVGDNYIDVHQLAWCFAQMGMHVPPANQIVKKIRMFDLTVHGKLNRSQFIELMIDHIHAQPANMEFTAQLWCPAEIFGMGLDLLPWGEQITTIVEDECVTRGRTGPFAKIDDGAVNKACKRYLGVEFRLSKGFMTSWEMSRARWIHAEGNPLDWHKLAGYLAEALLMYAIIASDYVQGEIVSAKNNVLGPLCCGFVWFTSFTLVSFHKKTAFFLSMIPGQSTYLWLNWLFLLAGFWSVRRDSERAYGGVFGPFSAHYIVRIIAVEWWALRVFVLIFRKIGSANMFVAGQPQKKQSRARQRFPVQISSLQDVTDMFLQVKKFPKTDTESAFRESTLGYGFIPHDLDQCQCCESCSTCTLWWGTKVCSKRGFARNWIMRPLQSLRGINSLYTGEEHFEIEKNNGGGWKASTRRTVGWRARLTRMDHVVGFMEDIKWVLVKKEGISFSDLVLDTMKAMFTAFVLAVPVALLSSYPCSDTLNLRGRDIPSTSALQRNPNSLSWAKWSTFNSTGEQMAHFDGAQQWCAAFDKSASWLTEIEASSIKTGRPCVCPLQPGEICNPNLDPSLYFRPWGQPNWCQAWEQGTQFHYPYAGDQKPRPANDHETPSGYALLDDRGWPWPPPSPPNYLTVDTDWSQSKDGHFDHDQSLQVPVYSSSFATLDVKDKVRQQTTGKIVEKVGISTSNRSMVLETERDYRSRDQPCECLTPVSTAVPSSYILMTIFTYFLFLVEPVIVFIWLKHRPWYCQLGVAGLGDVTKCAIQPAHAMGRLFKRRHTVELSENIQRLHQLLVLGRTTAGGKVARGLDNSTLLIHSLPEQFFVDNNNNRRNVQLDRLFKRGHRDEFLGATLFEYQGSEAGIGNAGGWGALVTVRDHVWIQQVVHQSMISVEHDPRTGPMIVLQQMSVKSLKRKYDYLKVSAFPGPTADQSETVKLENTIKDFDEVMKIHNDKVDRAYSKLHASENKHVSQFRHMSAMDQANSLFGTIDFDSNGFVTKDELQKLISREKTWYVNMLFDVLKSAEPGEDMVGDEASYLLPDVLEKDENQVTRHDYAKVFGLMPETNGVEVGQRVHDELEVRRLLSKGSIMTVEEKNRAFARLPNGKMRDSVARRLDVTKLKHKVNTEGSVRQDDMRELEAECKAAAKVIIKARLSVLDDNEMMELHEFAAERKKATKKQAEQLTEQQAEATPMAMTQPDSKDHQEKAQAAVNLGDKHPAEERVEAAVEARKISEKYVHESQDMEDEDAREVAQMAEETGNAEDKWALLRVRLEREAVQVQLAQGLVDMLTLPGWLEEALELIVERMQQTNEDKLIDVDDVDDSLSIDERRERAKRRLRVLAYGGDDKAETVDDRRCCGPIDDTVDEDTIDIRVAIGTAHLQHLEALQHKNDLDVQKNQIDVAAQPQEQADRFDEHGRQIYAELKRSDPAEAHKSLALGQRIVKGQFRRWFLELLGGEEHFHYFRSESNIDWALNAARKMQNMYGSLMTVPDCPEAIEIGIGDRSQRDLHSSDR